MFVFQHCLICRPSDSTVSENARIDSRTVATLALTARRSNHSARSNPHYIFMRKSVKIGYSRLVERSIAFPGWRNERDWNELKTENNSLNVTENWNELKTENNSLNVTEKRHIRTMLTAIDTETFYNSVIVTKHNEKITKRGGKINCYVVLHEGIPGICWKVRWFKKLGITSRIKILVS